VRVEVSVRDVRVEGNTSFRDVHARHGVGDVSLRTPSSRDEGSGSSGHRFGSRPGQVHSPANAGVEDVKLRSGETVDSHS